MTQSPDLFTIFAQLEALPEWRMREYKLEQIFAELDNAQAAQIIERMILAAQKQRSLVYPGYVTLFKIATQWEISKDRRLSLWLQEAVDSEYFWAAAFLSHPVDPVLESVDRLAGADVHLVGLTLGALKARLRKVTHARELEKYFPFDSDQVVEIMLAQPKMDEHTMMRYVLQRPLPESIALGMCLHEKWIHYQSLVDTLVQNSSLPQWMALKLMPICSAEALDGLIAEPGRGRNDLRLWASKLRNELS